MLPIKLCFSKGKYIMHTHVLIFSLNHHFEATQWKPWGQFVAQMMVCILLVVLLQGMLISGRLVKAFSSTSNLKSENAIPPFLIRLKFSLLLIS